MDGFYSSPGQQLEPGDLFLDIPFPSLKFPLEWFRPNQKEKSKADVFSADTGKPKDGDTARGAFQHRPVMLLSHGCELDGVQKHIDAGKVKAERRYWLAAPVLPLAQCSPEMQTRTREGRQPNKFFLPAQEGLLDNADYFVDLRKITPINIPYFLEAVSKNARIMGLTEPARLALQAHLGMFFSGFVFYTQNISCPHCSGEIDPTTFLVASDEDEDQD